MSVNSIELSLPEGSSFKGLSIKMDTRVSKVSRECQLNSTTKTKRILRRGIQ